MLFIYACLIVEIYMMKIVDQVDSIYGIYDFYFIKTFKWNIQWVWIAITTLILRFENLKSYLCENKLFNYGSHVHLNGWPILW